MADATDTTTASPAVVVALLLILITALLGFIFNLLSSQKRSSTGESEKAEEAGHANSRPSAAKGKKLLQKHAAPKAVHPHHPLDINTLKGHGDSVTGMAFSANGKALATACEDGVVRVFKLEDVTSKSFKFLRLALPPGTMPKGVAFGEGTGQLLLSATDPKGGCLLMFGPASGKEAADARAQGRLPAPEVKWEKRRAHDGQEIMSIVSVPASYGSGDGSAIAATCSQDGTDVRLWSVADGKSVGKVDSNQLQNHMAGLSPDGRFLAVAAFTSDVKVWEIVYGKDGAVREVDKVMQLKGHTSAVTWLSFSSDGLRIATASKDGTIKLWNLNVRYNVNEDPKCLKSFPIPEPPPSVKQRPHLLERIALSPDNAVLAVTFGPHSQWVDMNSGALLSTAESAHEGHILWAAWSPAPHRTAEGMVNILATCGADKKVKLWTQPKSNL